MKSSLPGIFFTDEQPRQYPAVFVYGVAGIGKTSLLDQLENPLALATEEGNTRGMSSLADMHIPYIPISSMDRLTAVVGELHAKAKPGELYYSYTKDGQKQDFGPFNYLGVDSYSGVGYLLEEASKAVHGVDQIWDPTNAKWDPRNAYPYITERGLSTVRRLMKLPVPIVITCREQLLTEGNGNNMHSYPAPEIPGRKLPREIVGLPEATIRMRWLNRKRVFVTQTEDGAIARVRLKKSLKCPKYIKANLRRLIDLLNGDETALEDLRLEK